MENQIQSRQVGCCGARTWSLVIGWLQTICSGILILMTVVLFFGVKEAYKQAKTQDDDKISKEDKEKALVIIKIMALLVFVTILITLAIELVSGIILILGVKQQNAKKLRVWYIVQIVFLVFAVVGAVFSLFSGEFGEFTQNLLSILITIFCIWVVNIHRQELLSALPGTRKV